MIPRMARRKLVQHSSSEVYPTFIPHVFDDPDHPLLLKESP